MRRVVPVTVGSFVLGLDAFVVAGILPIIGRDLDVPVSTAGQLVTAFTLSYALLSPIAATFLTGRPIRTVLLLALVVFVLGNVTAAVATTVPMLLLSRVVAGLGAGIYAPMSAATASSLARPDQRGRALAMIMTGMSSGAVLGVPVGLLLAKYLTWRWTFCLVAVMGVVAMAGIRRYLPELAPSAPPPLRDRVAVLGDRRVLGIVAITVFCSGTSLGMYTYVAPLFSYLRPGVDLAGYVWIWGLGGLIGSLVIGRLIDRWRDTRGLLSCLFLLLAATLALLPVVGGSGPGLVILLLLWGATGWSTLTPQQHRLMALRPGDGTIAVALNASALYSGTAGGAALGGLLLAVDLPVPYLAVVFGGLALAAGALNLLTPAAVDRRPAKAGFRHVVAAQRPASYLE